MPFDSSHDEETSVENPQEHDPAHVADALLAFVRRHAAEAGTSEEDARRIIFAQVVEPVLHAFTVEQDALDQLLKTPGGSLQENIERTGAEHLMRELKRLLTCAASKENPLQGIATRTLD